MKLSLLRSGVVASRLSATLLAVALIEHRPILNHTTPAILQSVEIPGLVAVAVGPPSLMTKHVIEGRNFHRIFLRRRAFKNFKSHQTFLKNRKF